MADKVIQVNVTSTKSQRVSVSPGNVQNEISATPDTSQYYSNLAKSWAIGAGLILNEDYSSKHYAKESANSASSAKNYADASQVTYTNVQNVANEALADIEGARVDAVDNITTAKSESIASVEAKGNEVVSAVNEGIANIEAKSNEANALVNTGIAEINTAKTEAVNAVTTTKNNAVTEINKEVTDGKKELNDIIEAGGLNINDKITNCLLEVPQNIKLELNNGTLTLKAGSKVIVPNGFEADGTTPKFNEIILNHDKVVSPTGGSGTCLVSMASDGISYGNANAIANCVSGAGVTPKNYGLCYDTSTNIINRWGAGTISFQSTLPFAQVTQTDGVITSIDQVFNGFGYIGSTIWVDKGVKGLIPNGRNEDGTLNNIEFTTSKVLTVTDSGTFNFTMMLNANKLGNYISYTFDAENNYNLSSNGSTIGRCVAGIFTRTNGVISNFQPKLAFQAVDYNEIKNNIISTCQKSTNGYLKFANNIIIQWGEISVGGNGTAVATLPIAFTNTNYQCSATCNVVSTGDDQNVSIGEKTTTTMKVCNGIGSTRTVMWIAIGY